MTNVIQDMLTRRIPLVADSFETELVESENEFYTVRCDNEKIKITGSTIIAITNGIYDYLRKICKLNWSWCGNNELRADKLIAFEGELHKVIKQKYRVYMNYCTLGYSMSWWNWERWEKEIDFMAMNGINMPLATVGTESVWFETLLEYGFSEEESLATVSGVTFWPWQLMTNIDGYMPPKNKNYVYERLALGKKIIDRMIEFGMKPIQQGFSGHVPAMMKQKFPKEKIYLKNGWCLFPKTAQLDPLSDLFNKIGTTFLKKQRDMLGAYHYYACDPFHENAPNKPWKSYRKAVGKAIDAMYKEFDPQSVWVMQSWSLREAIAKVVPRERLLILDINSEKIKTIKSLYGYEIVAGQLHNFGAKNAMQGKLNKGTKNPYYELKNFGLNAVGSGLFMEGIEQNPVIYELEFDLCTLETPINLQEWLNDYILRRYGLINDDLKEVWNILLKTVYRDDGYHENEVGSMVSARPSILPLKASPCDYVKNQYDYRLFENAINLLLNNADKCGKSDGYQFDLYDMTRQMLSNKFYENQLEFASAYKQDDIDTVSHLSDKAMEILHDLDNFLGLREEFTLNRWINDAHALATNEEERHYFDELARTQITLWGDKDGDTALFDYAWKEWSGLISEYYSVRWRKYYDYVLQCMHNKAKVIDEQGLPYFGRTRMYSTEFGRELAEFEKNWCVTYKEYPQINNKNVITEAEKLYRKWCNK